MCYLELHLSMYICIYSICVYVCICMKDMTINDSKCICMLNNSKVNLVLINPPESKYAKIPVRNNKPPLNKVFVFVPRILYFFLVSV